MKFVSSHDVAKAFGRFQDEALSDQPIAVTRYGRPTVVILSYADYERLRAGGDERRPRREVLRAGELPDDLLLALERATPPEVAATFDHELDENGSS